MEINAIGKACPMPVVLAKQALDRGEEALVVLVDNQTAVENLTRLASSQGMEVQVQSCGDHFSVAFSGERVPAPVPEPVCALPAEGDCAVFIGRDQIGDGSQELGKSLMKMFLYTLSQREVPPVSLLFMNAGVTLPSGEDEQVVESLRTLVGRGCEVLVCGTCLNYYKRTEDLKVGTISNMYDITDRLLRAPRVVTF